MKRVILTLLASAALAAPAVAAQQNVMTPKQPTAAQRSKSQAQKTQQQNEKQAGNYTISPTNLSAKSHGQKTQPQNEKQAENKIISPKSLSRTQVRRVQTALDKEGFNVGPTDGIWGPHTQDALQSFQKSNGLADNGKVNRSTLAALGVKLHARQLQG